MVSENITLEGHIIGSLMLSKVLDLIDEGGGSHVIEEIDIGRTRQQPSRAVIRVLAPDAQTLEAIIAQAQEHGAERG